MYTKAEAENRRPTGHRSALRIRPFLIAGSMGVFVFLLVAVLARSPLSGVDATVNADAHHFARGGATLVSVARVVTFFGSTVWLTTLVLGVALALAVSRRVGSAVLLVIVAAGGALLESGLKILVGRARPAFHDPLIAVSGKSFPSGHATNSTVIYGVLLLLAWSSLSAPGRRWAAGGAALLVCCVCASRVVLGAHWLTDVLAGVALGTAWLAIVVPLLVGRLSTRSR